jgi:protoheme IX farnesyltransferase
MLHNLKSYYRLTKPGIIRGNLLTAVAAYIYGAQGVYHLSVFLSLCIGTAFVIASGCVFNNIIDTDIDALMERTKNRELVVNALSKRSAYIYASVLGIAGILVLYKGTNLLTLGFGLGGLITYVLAYTFAKRKTTFSTLIGTVPGATPPVAGYLAATHHFDIACLFLFLVLVFWQMPHFLAIAIRRLSDYRSASIPVLPVMKGIAKTKTHITAYIIAFTVACMCLAQFGHLGGFYTSIMLVVGLYWLYLAITNTDKLSDEEWARKVFMFSLIALLIWNILIATNFYI